MAHPATVRGARRYRLTGPGAFDALFRLGERREGAWLQLVAAPARSDPGRTGYAIGTKSLRSAVARNRVRRVLREVVARARPGVAAFDVILRLKRGCAPEDVRAVAAEAERLLAALVRNDAQGSSR